MKKIFLYLPLFFAVLSCSKEADIKLPPSETKLVVTSFICPDDSIISAVVKYSVPKFANNGGITGGSSTPLDPGDIQNATVIISDGATSIQLPFDKDLFFYHASTENFPIVSGKTYYLTVTTPDGKKVSSSTTVPEGKFTFETGNPVLRGTNPTYLEYDFSIAVDDIPNQTNYLLVASQYETMIKRSFNNDIDTLYNNSSAQVIDTDEKIAKTRYIGQISNGFYYTQDTIVTENIKLSVLNVSRDFYLYNKSVSQAGSTGGNPFGDPVMVYTNITNGFGCFGSYVGNYATKKVK